MNNRTKQKIAQRKARQNAFASAISRNEPGESSNNEITRALNEASTIWQDLKNRVQKDPEFVKVADQKKIDEYQKLYPEFYRRFPMVSRYMICMGQYSSKAFRRHLEKQMSINKQASTRATPDNANDAWIRGQADYVRYLWEAYQKGRFKTADAQMIWKHAYDTLNSEVTEFKTAQEEVKERLKKEGTANKAELIKELVDRVSNGQQHVDERSLNSLKKALQSRVYEQRKDKTLKQLLLTVKEVSPVCEANGTADLEEKERAREEALNSFMPSN